MKINMIYDKVEENPNKSILFEKIFGVFFYDIFLGDIFSFLHNGPRKNVVSLF